MTTKRFGWLPDTPDHRDLVYAAPRRFTLPKEVDLRPQCPPVCDQGTLGSCTACAIGAAHQFDQMRQKAKAVVPPSRLFIYYNERAMIGTANEDSGAMIRDGFKSVAKQGVCAEARWPYWARSLTVKPPAQCYAEALTRQALTYQRVSRTLSQMKGCLAAGFPFVFGFSVYGSFETDAVAKTGVAPMPGKSESLLGGHAVLAVGYSDKTKRFLVRNSWGTRWGVAGYFTMPYDYLIDPNLSDDFWTVRLVECGEIAIKPRSS